jgi:hypothetical protein
MDHQESSSNALHDKPLKSGDNPENFVTYAEHEEAVVQLSQSEREVRRLRREVAKLEKSQAVTEDSPDAKAIKALLELWWTEVMGSKKRVAHGLESDRAPKVRAALRRRKKIASADKDVADPDHEAFDICRRAILGVVHDDWAMGRVKKSRGKAFNDIAEHILNTDGDIEKFAKLYDDQQAKPTLEAVPDISPPAKARRDGPVVKRIKKIEAGDAPPIDTVLHNLTMAGCEWRAGDDPDRWRAQCPGHMGDGYSLAIHRKPDGMVLVHCFVGCSFDEVLDALGLEPRALWANCEEDHQANGYRSPAERHESLPPHLKQAMRQLLARDEQKRAA